MTFPFVTRSLYNERIKALKTRIEYLECSVTSWANVNLGLEKTITQLKNRNAHLNNSYDQVSNQLSVSQEKNMELLSELSELSTSLSAEIKSLKAVPVCSKTSSKRKRKN